MHNSGHWLGLDVHDSGQYKMNKEWRLLEPGMALTVEPGIYITPNIPGVDPRWWNIGVRIEDDILVTPEGCHNFTQALPTNIHDVEALVRG
jgi:Xaa-Pro aminopeptidase